MIVCVCVCVCVGGGGGEGGGEGEWEREWDRNRESAGKYREVYERKNIKLILNRRHTCFVKGKKFKETERDSVRGGREGRRGLQVAEFQCRQFQYICPVSVHMYSALTRLCTQLSQVSSSPPTQPAPPPPPPLSPLQGSPPGRQFEIKTQAACTPARER